MSQDCRVLALSHESPDFISESCDTNLITNLHLQKRRHRNAEQAKSRATAMRMTKQRTRWQRHTTTNGEDDHESACNTPRTKAPAEETTHPTGTVHRAQHISELARCPFLTAPASGSSEGGETKKYSGREIDRDAGNAGGNCAPAEETAGAESKTADTGDRPQAQTIEKSGGAGEWSDERCRPRGEPNDGARRGGSHPDAEEGEPHKPVGMRGGAQEPPIRGWRGVNTEGVAAISRGARHERAGSGGTEITPEQDPERPPEVRENKQREPGFPVVLTPRVTRDLGGSPAGACKDDTPVHVNKGVKYETGKKILRKSRRKGNDRNDRNDQSPASVIAPDILLPDTIPAARPARNPPGSTMLDHVAPRPRPPPGGDAEG
jgi:hypothetical protein